MHAVPGLQSGFASRSIQIGEVSCRVELKETVGTAWGFGVVQKINDDTKPAGRKGADAAKETAPAEPVTEVFLGYKHYALDVDLIDAASTVPSKNLNDFDAVMPGRSCGSDALAPGGVGKFPADRRVLLTPSTRRTYAWP
jgi:hypothetical protein